VDVGLLGGQRRAELDDERRIAGGVADPRRRTPVYVPPVIRSIGSPVSSA
jgi:hypothetical protein